LAAARAEMAAHIGGAPSASQRVLIDRCAWLRLHVMLLDEKVAGGKPLTPHDQRAYLAFSNSLVRAMREFGMKPAAAPTKTLQQHLAELATLSEGEAA
jgi:hypothetical protein